MRLIFFHPIKYVFLHIAALICKAQENDVVEQLRPQNSFIDIVPEAGEREENGTEVDGQRTTVIQTIGLLN